MQLFPPIKTLTEVMLEDKLREGVEQIPGRDLFSKTYNAVLISNYGPLPSGKFIAKKSVSFFIKSQVTL